MRRIQAALHAVPIALAAAAANAEPPKVVVSILPLHGLVAAVTDGVGAATLLVAGIADPHTYTLKPSQARALADARLVVWAGPGVETFLAKPLAALARKAKVLRLDRERGMKLYRAREGGLWEPEEEDEGHDHGKKDGDADERGHGAADGHIWLDPDNAAAIVRAAVRELSALDPANAARYAANGRRAQAALKALDAELRRTLAPVRTQRFIVLHDSIQYFEKRYRLAAAGSITLSADKPPSARRLHEIRSRILKDKVVCVFGEPQHPDRLVKTVVEGTDARTGVIDTDGGAGIPPGKDAYFILMRNLAESLAGCLAAR